MRHFLPTLVLCLASTALAQTSQTTLTSQSAVTAFVQTDTNTPSSDTVAASNSITWSKPMAVSAEKLSGSTREVHARTKATLRILDDLPAVRVFEAGEASALISPTKSRKAGTSGTSSGSTVTPGAHSFLLKFKDKPGRKLRLQVRYRSTTVGTDITGGARVDIGNDATVEFSEKLDGNSYLKNFPVTLDANGEVKVSIETEALISSTSPFVLSYAAWVDVSLEPIPPATGFGVKYGTSCGPDATFRSWVVGENRHFSTTLTGAPPNGPVVLAPGWRRLSIPISASCYLLTEFFLLIPAKADSSGNLFLNLPTRPTSKIFSISGQYTVDHPLHGIQTSNGMELQMTLQSGKAFDYFSLNHVLSTGQSLSIGWDGWGVLSTTQPYKNKMFKTGMCKAPGTDLAPLVESGTESHHSGFANLITEVAEKEVFKDLTSPANTHEVLVSCHGVTGKAYSAIKKGTAAYALGIKQVEGGIKIADGLKRSYVVRCVTNVHGESDHIVNNANYDKDLVTWQNDYETDVQNLTGQAQPVPMLHSQFSSWTKLGGTNKTTTSSVVLKQLSASVENPRKLPMVGPKYVLLYHTDGLHLKNTGYRHMGEYYAKVYRHVVMEGGTWEPLRPVQASRSGKVVEVRFWVPVPPLKLDTLLVKNPGNYGFEYTDDSTTPPTISSVELVGEDTVRITLSAAPTGANKLLRYAYTGVANNAAGPLTGPRGNLRDSDDSTSRNSEKLYNWCVHFEQPVD